MTAKERSATQVFREVQLGQLLDHEHQIRDLEAEVKRLRDEAAALRAGGGTTELQALPEVALRTLLGVFDAVPIPDLSAFERQQCVRRLATALDELQAREPERGGLAPGAWRLEDGAPALEVAEGDGATVARLTREVVRVLGETAGRYLAQMVEFQGTTPDQVSRARASQLVDASTLMDAKAHFSLLPGDDQRAMFDQHVDQLIVARDRLHATTQATDEACAVLTELLQRIGKAPAKGAPLLTLARTLAAGDGLGHDSGLRAEVAGLVSRYAALLPPGGTLAALGLADTPFRRGYLAALEGECTLPFLAEALGAALADHELVAAGLRDVALEAIERGALRKLAGALEPAEARDALARVAARSAEVDAAQARLEEHQRAICRRFGKELEAQARERIARSEQPETSAAAFERLDKTERAHHLARLWQLLVAELRAALDGPEGLTALEAASRAALVQALGRDDARELEPRRQALDEVAEALRSPASQGGDGLVFDLATPIDVEDGLLARQAQDLAGRVEAFLERFRRSRTGVPTLADAVTKLSEIDATPQGKRAALDALLTKAHQGKHNAKQLAAAAFALAEEQRELEEGRARVEARKVAAFAAVQPRLARLDARVSSYDEAWGKLDEERRRLAAAAQALEAVAARRVEAAEAGRRLGAGPGAGDEPVAAARAVLAGLEAEAAELGRRSAAVEAAHAALLEEANGSLRKRAGDFVTARDAALEVGRDLQRVDALRAAQASYVAAFAACWPELRSPEKVRDFAHRERKKADTLRLDLLGAAKEVAKAAAGLARPAP